MNTPTRTFTDSPGFRHKSALLLGIVGSSSSGKTFSALRLATGMQRVYGGEIFGIDTESDRMKHYAPKPGEQPDPSRGKFAFRHVPFAAPFGPFDYLAAIQHCIDKGASVIVIDSMTHEHSGIGGVMDQIEDLLDSKCGENLEARDKFNAYAHKCIKPQRRKLNNAIVQLGSKAAFIFCYRANDVQYPRKLGWTAETTSTLHYEMMQRFLLLPGSAGVPTLTPETQAEKMLVKQPDQFKGWFKQGEQISEDMGERMARWALGDGATTQPATRKAPTIADMIEDYRTCPDRATFEAMETARKACWESLKPDSQKKLKAASDAAFKRIDSRPVETPTDYTPGVDEPRENELFPTTTGTAH